MTEIFEQYRGRKVLVTGGLGFIGSALSIRLVQEGAEVCILDSLIPEFGGNIFNIDPVKDQVSVSNDDMRDSDKLIEHVKNQDFVFHLAGHVSHGDSMKDPDMDLAVNCVATMNLVEACRYHNPKARLIYSSTRQVYGVPQSVPVSEDHPTVPVDVNGINKLAAEYYHLLYHKVYDLKSVVLRLTNTYGPRLQIRNDRQGFAGIFIRHALKGEELCIFGSGDQLRDFNYIDDVLEALLLAGIHDDCYGKVLNLGAPPRSINDFVQVLSTLAEFSCKCVPFPEEKSQIDIGDYYGDYTAFNRITGWKPRVDLESGLASSLDFYRQHPDHYWR